MNSYLLIFVLFHCCMIYFLLQNTKEEILKDVLTVFSIQWRSVGSKTTLNPIDWQKKPSEYSSGYLLLCYTEEVKYKFGKTQGRANEKNLHIWVYYHFKSFFYGKQYILDERCWLHCQNQIWYSYRTNHQS